jgi:hypothetical protein
MRNEAWTDKQLHTALASWTELRHDTILYAKQSCTAGSTGMPPEDAGYVEPNPEFYARLLNLCDMTKAGLDNLNCLPAEIGGKLDNLSNTIARLLDISVRELENKVLDADDYEFIHNFAAVVEASLVDAYDDMLATDMVADVHTDINTSKCLEEGTGYLDWLVVAFKLPTGDIQIGAGPVLSYYEFKQPMAERLTDEEWWEMLLQGDAPARPPWVSSFSR